jgi:hypothetical protein
MKIKLYFIFYLTSILLLGLSFSSCEDDSISTNSSYRLRFSADTVSFDTIFTTITSATAKIKVYNKNKDRINISSIKLAGGTNSPYVINVSGRQNSNQEFNDIELGSDDSLYVFINITPKPSNQNTPLVIRDSIEFLMNGNKQYVQLEAAGQDVIILRNKTVVNDTTLTNEKPYLIYGNLTLASGKSMTIEKGSTLYFHDNSGLVINGSLNAVGSLDLPITFRGDRLDYLFEGLPYDTLAGQWNGIRLNSSSENNKLENVDIRSGKTGLSINGTESNKIQVNIKNTRIHNFDSCGIAATFGELTVVNSQISNCAQNCIYLLGGEANFTHCTIANFMSRIARTNLSVKIKNYVTNNSIVTLYPVTDVQFKNCIIAGNQSKEITLDYSINGQNVSADYSVSFFNCLITGTSLSDNHYVNTIWTSNTKDIFVNKDKYPYNFELSESSPAINTADETISILYPLDKKGNSRMSDSGPDIGAFEWIHR